ncbi:MAG TPA: carbohydrate-binding protein [Polyangiaceae bacterium]|nr:carbohydrate-binding protein [Polyangiaceae bacterium]
MNRSIALLRNTGCGLGLSGLGLCLGSALSLYTRSAAAQTAGEAVVSWNTERQTMRGFGASSAFFGARISNQDADWFFSKDTGIGLSMLRMQIGLPADVRADGSEPPNASPVATAPELATAKQAVARGAQVWASAWSPPPIWKTTNNKNGSGTNFGWNNLQPTRYQNYADYLANFVQSMASQGVPLIAISPQNEPDYVATWDNAQWSGNDMFVFIRDNLGPTFKTRGITASIVAPDSAVWGAMPAYVDPLMADPIAKGYVGVIATHPYGGGDLNYSAPRDNGKEFWQTETSQEGNAADPGMNSAIDMLLMLQDHLTVANMNAWHYWALTIDQGSLNDPQRMNPALMQAGVKYKRGYALGNFAKFVRPGFKRIEATRKPVGAVSVTAFKDATHLAIVAINAGSGPVAQTFRVYGRAVASMTPWVTSDSFSLAARPAVAVSAGTFTYSLPARSVTTFYGDATPGGVDEPPPPPPLPSGADGFVLEAENPNTFFDTTPGNTGTPSCGTTAVDAEPTLDWRGGTCTVGWTAPTEWLQYDFQLTNDDEYVVTLRVASLATDKYLHLEVDGVDVSGPVAGPGLGWQSFADADIPGVFLSAGAHTARVVFDSGDLNLNYLAFARVSTTPPPNQCQMSCDDGNPCTTDSCLPLTGCKFQNNTLACADDGNTCTNDLCSAGTCTHPANSSCAAPPTVVSDGLVLEAEKPSSFSDTSAGNSGSASCGTSDVDAEPTSDPKGGTCNVGWTAPTEWLQYSLQLANDDEYVVTLRLASLTTGKYLHLELDGVDVSGPVAGPGLGWQSFVDAAIPGVFLSAGLHTLRVVFETGDMNLNYLSFARDSGTPPTNQCQMSCDDNNPCTTDSCDPLTGCKFQNNALACADDGNTCTNDVCSAGVCTHPNNTAACASDGNTCTNDVCSAGVCTHPNNTAACADDGNSCTNDVCSAGTCTHPNNTAACADDGSTCTNDVCSAGTCTHPSNNTCNTSTPCSGLCTNPVIFTSNNYNSGNLGTGAVCYQTNASLNGGVCGNLASGRKLTVNGVQMSCTSNWPTPLPAKRNGGYCVQTTAGNHAYAFFSTW